MTSLKQQLEGVRQVLIEYDAEFNRGPGNPKPARDGLLLDSILADLSRPFDPVECGFVVHIHGHKWKTTHKNAAERSVITLIKDCDYYLDLPEQEGFVTVTIPNHFDGVRLLLSLGVIKEGE